MDPHQSRKCKWEGCLSYDVASRSVYCQEHKRQHYQARPPESDKNQAFSEPAPIPPLGPFRNHATPRLGINDILSPVPSSPSKEKKQLPGGKHVARKSAKHSSDSGLPYAAFPTSPNVRPAKRQRTSGVHNASELYSRSDSSSFAENGIPQQSNRGMFRQPEERTYKLSALDDFALRPKNSEAVTERTRLKLYNNQRQFHQGDNYPNNSSRLTSTPSEPPRTTNLSGSTASGPFLIDLTGDDDPESTLPRPKLQVPPENHVTNGITTEHRPSYRHFDKNPGPQSERNFFAGSGNHQRCEGPLRQPGGTPSSQAGRCVEQGPRALKPSQNGFPSAPNEQPTLNPLKEISLVSPTSKQKLDMPVPNSVLGPAHKNSPIPSNEFDIALAEERQPANGNRSIHPNEEPSAPVGSNLGASETEQIMTKKNKKIKKSAVQANLATNVPAPLEPRTAVVTTPEARPGPLSSLLRGHKWKEMTPEERRLFWVSQHDPDKLDAHIYSENNRPFRPGDVLFGVANDALPPRPKRPATHFAYIDPRTHYSQRQSEDWYYQKQKEISARGNRKVGFGNTIKRAAEQKRAAERKRAAEQKRAVPEPNPEQTQDKLPQRVRENPKWLAAVDILSQIEAQARHQKKTNPRWDAATGKAKENTPELVSDADIESS
ncbi:hypothetical protein F4802DRAFT_38191 [Xylaria palmicola]|nr:hypothetical protein F4802DRAFT_38191 [Xylaria palmicola]